MSFYDTFSTDPDLEAGSGVALDYGDAGKITIHRAGGANRKFSTVLDAKLKPYRRQIENGTLDDKIAERVLAEAYAEAVIIGWSGVSGRDGKPLAFTKANVVGLLTDLPDLFADIKAQATRVSNFRRAAVEADAGN